MTALLPWFKSAVLVGWLLLLANLVMPWPHPYNIALQVLLQITLAGHLAICAGYRVRQAKPLPWSTYGQLLVFGIFALLTPQR